MNIGSYIDQSKPNTHCDFGNSVNLIAKYFEDIKRVHNIDDERIVVNRYSQSLIFSYQYQTQQELFKNQKREYPEFIKNYETLVDFAFTNSINDILSLNPMNLNVSLTDSKSIFYTFFYKGYKIRLEIFYEDERFESAYTCYQASVVVARNFGDINYLLKDLKKLLTEDINSSNSGSKIVFSESY